MRKTIAIIGEGITEKYYIESLKGLSPFSILPKELGKKASSLSKLAENINESIEKGFDEVYCLIDMDNKTSGISKEQYYKIKNKYHNKIFGKKSKGIQCKVVFIENERCLELWFLFYFLENLITRQFNAYSDLEKELKKFRPLYDKSEKYFKSIVNIHTNFETQNPKGSIINACKKAKLSLESRIKENREHTYSEMHLLIEALGIAKS